jgi:hypothetical protein
MQRIAVMGAAGRMGQALIAAIDAEPRTSLHAALEHDGHAALGRDMGGVPLGANALEAVLHARAIVDFTTPAATAALAALAAQARIVHVCKQDVPFATPRQAPVFSLSTPRRPWHLFRCSQQPGPGFSKCSYSAKFCHFGG